MLLSGLVGCATGQPTVIGVHTQERDAGSVVDHGRVLDRLPALKSRLKGVRPEQQLLVSASDFTPFETVTVDGVPFQIGVNDHGCVVYVATTDPRFSTPEGIAPGATLDAVLGTGAEKPLNELGWAAYTTLPSGWSAAFESVRKGDGEASNRETSYYGADPRVAWVFKRIFWFETCRGGG